jgi:large repetitive protein
MPKLSLYDLIAPYYLAGSNVTPSVSLAVMSALYVRDFDMATDAGTVCVWGVAEIDGDADLRLQLGPGGLTFDATGMVSDAVPPPQQTPSGTWIDWHDMEVEFRLTVPRVASPLVTATGVAADVGRVLTALSPGGTPSPDFPNTQIQLDLLLTLVTIHLPFLRGAALSDDNMLVDDPAHPDVKIVAPRVLLRIIDGDPAINGGQAVMQPLSFGAQGLDDDQTLAEAQLVEMVPPYAFLGSGTSLGFGFRSAILDLDNSHTPPDIRSQFGIGDDWQGVYLPEVLVFLAAEGMKDLAAAASARTLLIGIGNTPGVWGDFELDILDAEQGPSFTVRFHDEATGRTYRPRSTGDKTARVELPRNKPLLLVVDIGEAVAPCTVEIDGKPVSGQKMDYDVPASAADVVVKVSDAATNSDLLTIAVTPVDAPLPAPGGGTAGKVTLDPASQTGGYAIGLISQTDTTALLGVYPPTAPDQITTVPPDAKRGATAATVSVEVPSKNGADPEVKVTWTGQASQTARTTIAYYRFARPDTSDDVAAYVDDPSHTGHTAVAGGDRSGAGQWSDGVNFHERSNAVPGAGANVELKRFIDNLPSNAQVTVTGYASYEPETGLHGDPYNNALSQRRADGLKHLIEELAGATPVTVQADGVGNTPAYQHYQQDAADYEAAYSSYWRAEATYELTEKLKDDVDRTVTVTRQPAAQVPAPRLAPVPAPKQGKPDSFRSFKAIVRVAADDVLAWELRLVIDFELERERLRKKLPNAASVTAPVAEDGVVIFDVIGSHDSAIGEWRLQASIRAATEDRDGLWRLTQTGELLDMLGLATVFAPLVPQTGGTGATEEDIWKLGAVLAAVHAIASTDFVHVVGWTVHGGELVGRLKDGATDYTLLFDLETALTIDFKLGNGFVLLKCSAENPLKVRYRALGTRLNAGFDANAPSFEAVFDSSKGYTIDVPDTGIFDVPAPLGSILQVLGAKIAKQNPLILELDLGMAADLGVVSVDRAAVRAVLPQAEGESLSVSITALQVGLEIPGVLSGSGYLAIEQAGPDGDEVAMKGRLDLSLEAIGVRVAAGIWLAHVVNESGEEATAVKVDLEVDFPVPIVLGTSGLGIYGFNGLFAMHFTRTENPAVPVPALDWFVNTVEGQPTDDKGWKPALDRWAFGVGAALGTLEGGKVLKVKGMLVLELPGPRVLLAMKAKLLDPDRPKAEGTEDLGAILAIIDLDVPRGTITIGMVATYEAQPLIVARVPASAYFNWNVLEDFELNLGTFAEPVSVDVLGLLRARGYFMVHGDGIKAIGSIEPPKPLQGMSGFSIVLGAHVPLRWGAFPIIYLQVAASFDVGISFSPFHLGGQLTLSGSLHLVIVSIGASASLTIDSSATPTGGQTRIEGSVCGAIDLFFFSIEGCVDFALGSAPPQRTPPPLVREMSLVSRSPALLEGSGTIPIDAALGQAAEGGEPIAAEVSVDVIPVLVMDCPPLLSAQYSSFCESPGQVPNVTSDGWIERGDGKLKYVLKSVTLTEGTPPTSPSGALPKSVWWSRDDAPGGVDPTCQLALMNWVPTARPKALERSQLLTDDVIHRWGNICHEVAPPAAVLWTFEDLALGQSPDGWTVEGTAWPDPEDAWRSTPPATTLKITEPWRSGSALADGLRGLDPARVVESTVGFNGVPAPPFRVLEGPFTYPAKETGTNRAYKDLVEAALDVTPLPLQDRFATTVGDLFEPLEFDAGPWHSVRLLVLLPRLARLTGLFTLQALDAAGMRRGTDVVVGAATPFVNVQQNPPEADLPARWRDATKPWRAGAVAAAAALNGLAGQFTLTPQGYDLVVLRVSAQQFKLTQPPARLRVGMANLGTYGHELRLARPSYLIGAIEFESDAERLRHAWDETTHTHDKGKLEEALTTDPSDQPLLQAGTTYTVAVAYDAWVADRDGEWVSDPQSLTQSFAFKTTSSPPETLDPWVLCTNPSEGERFHFYEEMPVISLSTNTVDQLLAAYGRTLEITIMPSSPTAATVLPLAAEKLDPSKPQVDLTPVLGEVLSPWEQTVRDLAEGKLTEIPEGLPCIDADAATPLHFAGTVPVPLEPYTDYVLELGVTPPLPGEDAAQLQRPMFRRAFSTGRYPSWQALGTAVHASRIDYGHLADAGLFADAFQGLGDEVAADRFEAAMRDAEMGAMQPPAAPRVRVIWGPGDAPQPVAVLIDTPEPLWRSRLEPQEKQPDPNPLGLTRWALLPTPWLEPVETSVGVVQRFVRDTSGARTLVLLNAGQRGKTLELKLRRHVRELVDNAATATLHANLLSAPLLRAPWEPLS